mmetsp:Transcript_77439/g.149600  ORF Transcript_77439/g.149600 Transcript_77439/m.149600 type:complete len:408 (-) Transcript_77439:241-1464(-)
MAMGAFRYRCQRGKRNALCTLACSAAIAIHIFWPAADSFVPGPDRSAVDGGTAALSFTKGDSVRQNCRRGDATWAGLSLGTMFCIADAAQAADAPGASQGDWFQPFVDLNAALIGGIGSVTGPGLAIIVYTVIIKVLTFPISQLATRSSSLLRLVNPQVEEIQKKYENDDDRKNMLTRKLYNEVGINPFVVLVSVVVQLPLFIGIFRAVGKLARDSASFQGSFLWIPSLAGPVLAGNPSLDWLLKTRYSDHFEPLVGWDKAVLYLALPIILVVAQFVTNRQLSTKRDPDFVESVGFPAFVGISALVSPAGLGLYWLTNNLLTAAQTAVVQQQVDEEFPQYKAIYNAVGEAQPADGTRYTRKSPFSENKESEVLKDSLAALEEGTTGPAVSSVKRGGTRKARRQKKKS